MEDLFLVKCRVSTSNFGDENYGLETNETRIVRGLNPDEVEVKVVNYFEGYYIGWDIVNVNDIEIHGVIE